jgi:DNA polymerase-3 subunit epsilon
VTSPARGGSLVDRARDRLLEGPADTLDLARTVLRLSGPPSLVRTAVFSLLGSDARFRVDANGVWTLGDVRAALALDELRYAVVDVEATGGEYLSGDRIIEIAIAQVHRGQVGELWHTLVNPGRSLPFGVQHLTGIGETMVLDAPFFDHVAPEVARRLQGRLFVAHNVAFDWRLVYAELNEALGSAPSLRRLCTIRMSRFLLPRVRRRNLDALARHFGIVNHARHRAHGDALTTARVLVRLLDEARARGIYDLNALDRFIGIGPSAAGKRRRRGLREAKA